MLAHDTLSYGDGSTGRVHSILSNISLTIICDADYVASSVSAVLRATTCSKFEFLAMRDCLEGISAIADIA